MVRCVLHKTYPRIFVKAMLSIRTQSSRSAFTFIESLIATAILAVTSTSVFYAFLRMNDFASTSRCDTAAKVVLERAVNLAMTSDWRD